MFNNIPREELIEFLIALADTFIHWAKWFLITGIVFAILGCAILLTFQYGAINPIILLYVVLIHYLLLFLMLHHLLKFFLINLFF